MDNVKQRSVRKHEAQVITGSSIYTKLIGALVLPDTGQVMVNEWFSLHSHLDE